MASSGPSWWIVATCVCFSNESPHPSRSGADISSEGVVLARVHSDRIASSLVWRPFEFYVHGHVVVELSSRLREAAIVLSQVLVSEMELSS